MLPRQSCIVCGGALATTGLELEALPPCNAFSAAGAVAPAYPLAMAICQVCALVQLSEHPAALAVAPRLPWIVYNEPDAHLDAALAALSESLGPAGRALGVTPFDGPLLDRLSAKGWTCDCTDMLDGQPVPDGVFPYLETLQAQMRPPRLGEIARHKGKADLVLCRFLLEHSHDPVASLKGLADLLGPGGRIVIEVPESSKFLARNDYSFIWEEHICYFTPASLRRLAAVAGFAILSLHKVEGLQEDLLVAVLQPATSPLEMSHPDAAEITLFERFAGAFDATRAAYEARMAAITAAGGKIAIFGVGHQAIMFVNALGLGDQVALLADDHADKLGSWAPGARAPIVSSAALDADPALSVILLSTNPRIEDKIRAKFGQFLARGGKVYSIFSGIGRPTLIEPSP